VKRLLWTGVIVALLWNVGEACGPWYVLRAGLNPVFWQPFVRTIPESFGEPRASVPSRAFAGMAPGGNAELAAARHAYQAVARWRADHFQAWEPQEPPLLADTAAVARRAVEAALAANPSPIEAEELRLMRCKVTLREAEALLVVSRSKVVTPATAPGRCATEGARRAGARISAVASTPSLASEARGLAGSDVTTCSASAIERLGSTFDELARRDSASIAARCCPPCACSSRTTAGRPELADHLDEYFDTPSARALRSAISSRIRLGVDDDERAAMRGSDGSRWTPCSATVSYSRKGDASDRLAAGRRCGPACYMGDPAAALKIGASLPPGRGRYPDARGALDARRRAFPPGPIRRAEAASYRGGALRPQARAGASARRGSGSSPSIRSSAAPVDQLVAAFGYEGGSRAPATMEGLLARDGWYAKAWPYEAR
jgi:hypothetical protein